MGKVATKASEGRGPAAPTPPSSGAAMFAQFAKGSGQAPQYSTLAPVPANATGKFVQSFDERAIMNEQPPTTSGGPRGNPANNSPRATAKGGEDSLKGVGVYDDSANMRSDNQVLVRATPQSQKSDKDARPSFGMRIYRDASGEMLR